MRAERLRIPLDTAAVLSTDIPQKGEIVFDVDANSIHIGNGVDLVSDLPGIDAEGILLSSPTKRWRVTVSDLGALVVTDITPVLPP